MLIFALNANWAPSVLMRSRLDATHTFPEGPSISPKFSSLSTQLFAFPNFFDFPHNTQLIGDLNADPRSTEA